MSEAERAARRPDDDEAHDVLAAEEFAMPSPDPTIHHGPVMLPNDPTGIVEPHDVLAAEEFAMPAVRMHADVQRRRAFLPPTWVLLAAAALLLVGRRRRRAL
jgi:hypothetical protein